jgi:hypothetical protein
MIMELFGYNDGNGVFCGSAPRLYNEDLRPAGIRMKGLF